MVASCLGPPFHPPVILTRTGWSTSMASSCCRVLSTRTAPRTTPRHRAFFRLGWTLTNCISAAPIRERRSSNWSASAMLNCQKAGSWRSITNQSTRFEDGEHLTRVDLDKISSTRPIILEHVNAHACVVNSAALVCHAAKVEDGTPDPPGGSYRRNASGRPDGVLLELAYEYVSKCAPTPSVEEMAQAIVKAGEKMAELGISCASDMSTGHFGIERELQAYALAVMRWAALIHMRKALSPLEVRLWKSCAQSSEIAGIDRGCSRPTHGEIARHQDLLRWRHILRHSCHLRSIFD